MGNNGVQAGVCIAIADRWKANIIHYEELISGRSQCIILNVLGEGVAFIYMPQILAMNECLYGINLLHYVQQWIIGVLEVILT